MMAGYTVSVPNCLSARPDQVEHLYRAAVAAPPPPTYTLDLQHVGLVRCGNDGPVAARTAGARPGRGEPRRMAPGGARARAFGLSGPNWAFVARAVRSA